MTQYQADNGEQKRSVCLVYDFNPERRQKQDERDGGIIRMHCRFRHVVYFILYFIVFFKGKFFYSVVAEIL